MKAHTKGPWEITREDDSYASIDGDGWFALAKVPVRMLGEALDKEEGVANARLIAAAPDLLEALITSERNIVSLRDAGLPGPMEVWLEVVRAAISKASTPNQKDV